MLSLFDGMSDEERRMWRSAIIPWLVALGVVSTFVVLAAGINWLMWATGHGRP